MYRTPIAQSLPVDSDISKSPPKTVTIATKVRRSIGEREAAGAGPLAASTSPLTSKTTQQGPAKIKPRKALSQDSAIAQQSPGDTHSPPKPRYTNRTTEARACLCKAKQHLTNSRNLKTDIKNGVTEAIDRLYQIVKELEIELKGREQGKNCDTELSKKVEAGHKPGKDREVLLTRMDEHMRKLEENSRQMEELRKAMEAQNETLERATYASVAANQSTKLTSEKRNTLHSVVVTSTDETESSEEVLNRVRKAVDAKEGWINVEKVKKAKDRKVIMSLRTKEEQMKIKNKLEESGNQLTVEVVKNRDPLLMLRDVLSSHSDDEVLKALRNQNRNVFRGLNEGDDRVEIKYKRKARNPHTNHIIVATSPTIWRRATEAGIVHIDFQHIRVTDQSPLVQCTRCLGYGHSKRFCREPADLCSHCGGPHLRAECDELSAPPACRNCRSAKREQTEHNAFSQDCPVRKRWDGIARASVAYC